MAAPGNGAPRSTGRISNRAKIIAVARDLYCDQGYAATTIRQISRAAGLSDAAVYYHFDSKEDLFRTIMALPEESEPLPPAATVDEAITRLVEGAATHYETYRLRARELLSGNPVVRAAFVEAIRYPVQALTAVLEARVGVAARPVATAATLAARGVLWDSFLTGRPLDTGRGEAVLRTILAGAPARSNAGDGAFVELDERVVALRQTLVAPPFELPGDTRERLLAVATHLFAWNGYETTAVRDITQVCGVTDPALFYYFESKQALYDAVLAQGAAATPPAARPLTGGGAAELLLEAQVGRVGHAEMDQVLDRARLDGHATSRALREQEIEAWRAACKASLAQTAPTGRDEEIIDVLVALRDGIAHYLRNLFGETYPLALNEADVREWIRVVADAALPIDAWCASLRKGVAFS